MTTRSVFAKSALSAAVAATTLTGLVAVPSFAQAQSNGYYYDQCQREKTNRGTVGGVIGALAGAAVGANVAARKNRTEGALLGGAVGAVGGAAVGNSSAACRSGDYRSSYYDNGRPYDSGRSYDNSRSYDSGSYGNGYYSDRRYDPYYDGSRYDRSRYSGDDRYSDRDYSDRGYTDSYSVADRPPSADNCRLAESPIYLPDGRVQKRFVRVCQDSSGRYQVVE